MKIYRAWLLVWLAIWSTTWAWNVELKTATDQAPQIWLSNARAQSAVDVYIAWFDRDAQNEQTMFLSWGLEQGWQTGLQPVLTDADLATLEPFYLDNVPTSCPQTHRCFLALVALPTGTEPLDIEAWQEAALMPLTEEAGRDRMPGQSVFFAPQQSELYEGRANYAKAMGDGVVAEEATVAAPSAPTSPTNTADESVAQTEKPDIFLRQGNQLLYANGQASKLQVIDITEPNNPRLSAQTRLEGIPREIYQLNDFIVLLESAVNMDDQGTRVSVFQPAETQPGTLEKVSELRLNGSFLESRRRNEIIYTVAHDYGSDENGKQQLQLHLNGLMLDAFGHVSTTDSVTVPGYDPNIAIFPDHLVIANRNVQQWNESLVQVFDLSNPETPLQALGSLSVPGIIPSEFHLSVENQQLRLVYGSQERAGSALAVYDLTNSALPLIGKVENIAPGETLFATRFVGNLAYVVTYQRTDPLWVISLKNPAKPEILGELEIPGWSEKLFFHDDQLFAVGIHDQPLEGEEARWVRRVAVSLFDVSNPLKPQILDRFVPLAKEVQWSSSPALEDERALLLDWGQRYAALPLESWETEVGSHLQIVDFTTNQLNDAGRIDIGVPVLRSLELDNGLLGVLGDQSYFSVQWGKEVKVLGELELAANLTWTHHDGSTLWAAAMGNRGWYRLYALNPDEVQSVPKPLRLPRGYSALATDHQSIVFYNPNPLAIQVVDLASQTVYPAQTLESEQEQISYYWQDRSPLLVQGKRLYLAEQNSFQQMEKNAQNSAQTLRLPSMMPSQAQQDLWTLRTWPLEHGTVGAETVYTLPGKLLAVLDDGRLLTQEWGEQGNTRINLVNLLAEKTQLINSVELSCHYYQTSLTWTGKALYATCAPDYYYAPLIREDSSQPTEDTPIWRLEAARWLSVSANYTLPGRQMIAQASPEWIVTRPSNDYYDRPMLYDDVFIRRVAPLYDSASQTCEVYHAQTWQRVAKLENCPYSNEAITLNPGTDTRVWFAQGFEGMDAVEW